MTVETSPVVGNQAFANEILVHRDELHRAALRMTKSVAAADDLVQDTVMRAWLFWDRFQPGTNGRAWVHRILTNTFINGYRRRRREREILGRLKREQRPRQGWCTSRSLLPGELWSDEVRRALESLSSEFRGVLVLVDVEGKSYQDAALSLGCPVGTVMSRLHRARRAMRAHLVAYAAQAGVGVSAHAA